MPDWAVANNLQIRVALIVKLTLAVGNESFVRANVLPVLYYPNSGFYIIYNHFHFGRASGRPFQDKRPTRLNRRD